MSITRVAIVLLLAGSSASAYSVLTHEAIIDAAWDTSIKPILLQRYPNATAEELRKAHAFAYGGAIVQDLGYYPFGSRLFSDLVHYVRSGDFIENLLKEPQDLNEQAFALGALAHDAGDNSGHSIATNRAVPLVYPELQRRFGSTITYEEHPASHLKVEFGFDVVQVANGNYASDAYRDFIGFEVAKPALERAFQKTYGLELKDMFLSVDLAIGTFRYSVSQLMPELTKVAWEIKKNDLSAPNAGLTRQKFIYNLSRSSYEKEWGREYQKPGWFARCLAAVFRVIPKVGMFGAMAFRPPGPEAQKLFMASFNSALEGYRQNLAVLRAGKPIQIANRNFDTGEATRFGAYQRADEAWSELVRKLHGKNVDQALKTALERFYDGKQPQDPKVAAALADMLRSGGYP